MINWVELTISALFARASIKLISAAKDWQPAGSSLLRAHLFVGGGAAAAVWLLAGPVARVLGAPAMAAYLRVFAVDILLFAAAQAHRNILIGTGGYRQQAWIGAGRWTARLILIIVLVELGLSVNGAILGSIGASAVELLIGRFYIRPQLFYPEPFPTRRIWDFAFVLFFSALCLRMVRMDLFALKALGASLADTGVYGAAQNLSFMPSLLGMAISPLLLSTVTRLRRDGELDQARAIGRNGMRTVIAAAPFAAVAAGAASEIVSLIYPPEFSNAGPLVATLLFAGLATVMIAVTNALLVAIDRPRWTLLLTGPLVPLAVVGYIFFVPRYGAPGVAAVTTFCTVLGAAAGVAAVARLSAIAMPWATLARSAVLSLAMFAAAHFWATPGLWVAPKVLVLCAAAAGGLLWMGELKANEIAFLWSMAPGRGGSHGDE